jgi:hypothetical protein
MSFLGRSAIICFLSECCWFCVYYNRFFPFAQLFAGFPAFPARTAAPCWGIFGGRTAHAASPRCEISVKGPPSPRGFAALGPFCLKKRPPGANTFCARRKYWMKEAPKGTLYEPSPLETPPNTREFKGLGLRRLGSASAALPGCGGNFQISGSVGADAHIGPHARPIHCCHCEKR